jgi:hypothetical protein
LGLKWTPKSCCVGKQKLSPEQWILDSRPCGTVVCLPQEKGGSRCLWSKVMWSLKKKPFYLFIYFYCCAG